MLNKNTLINDFVSALDYVDNLNKVQGTTPAQAKLALAEKLADAVEKYVTSGEIKIQANDIQVSTSGSATAQTGGNTNTLTKNLE